MSTGIMGRSGARQSKRYWGMENPRFQVVAKTTKTRCNQVLATLRGDNESVDWAELQQCLLVGLQVLRFIRKKGFPNSSQVLVPPIRGKPFQTLSIVDRGDNSMS